MSSTKQAVGAFKTLGKLVSPGPGSRPTQIGQALRRQSTLTTGRAPNATQNYASKPSTLTAVGSIFALFSVAGAYWFGTTSAPNAAIRSTLPLSEVKSVSVAGDEYNIRKVWTELASIVGEENISDLDGDLEHHSHSYWTSLPWDPSHKPACIVYPASTEEVSQIMKICHARRIPVTGFSGGTSLEGHYRPTRGGVSVDFGRMNKVIAVNKGDLDVVVQPAVGWQDLNTQLAKDQLFFPPDPGPGAMIGGMVNTGCSGTNAYRYGTVRDWVINLTVVLADGTIIKTRKRPRKSSAGYNLTQMFIGSEGTLGLVTEATLKLTPLPQKTTVAVCSFKNIKDAADCVASIVGQALPLGAIEILDDQQMKFINEMKGGGADRQWNEAPTLFLKFGGTPDGVQEQLQIVRNLAKETGCLSFEIAKSKAEEADLWSARRDALWATMSRQQEGDQILTSDVAVPISHLPEAIEQAKSHMKELGLVGSIVGHAGDGNFHTILLYNEESRAKAEDFLHRMVDRALEADGTCTGEHGVGMGKREAVVQELGEETVAAMRQLKHAFDPLCLLNCNKIFKTQKE